MSKIASSDCVRLSKSLDRRNLEGYIGLMIKSFSHKGLGGFFYDGVKKGIQPKHTNKIATILDRLGNWRITFRFKDGDAYEVNYEDYH
jgi:plasmid maintenance system killer protein